MRKLVLLAAAIGAAAFVRRRAAEEGVTSSDFVTGALERGLNWLTGVQSPQPKIKS